MTEKRYDAYKKVELMKITGAFISYITTVDLTRSEYLLIQNVHESVIEKLNNDGDVDD